MLLTEQDIKNVRQAIENTYDCKADIIEYKKCKNETNKRTDYKEIKVIEKQSCRISYKTIANSNQSENENIVKQIVKLFIAPEIQVNPRFKNYSY